MTLKWKIDEETHGKLDENLQGLYKQQDDAFVLDCEGAEGADDIKGLRKALETEREHKRKAERQAKAAQEGAKGIDREKYEKLLEAEKKFDAQQRDAAEKNAAVLEENKTLKTALAEKDKQIETYTKQAVEGITKGVLASANANVALVAPHVKDKVRELLAANPELTADDELLNAHVEELRNHPDIGAGFKSSGQSGGGMEPGTAGGGGTIQSKHSGKYPTRQSEFTDRQRIDYQREFGVGAILDLPE